MSRRLRDIYARSKPGRMTGAEMARAMQALGLDDAKLAEDLSVRLPKVVAWRKGEEDIPHMLALLLAAWGEPGALTRSRAAGQFLVERATEAADSSPPTPLAKV